MPAGSGMADIQAAMGDFMQGMLQGQDPTKGGR